MREQARHAEDAVERRAQFVRQRRKQGRLCAQRFFGGACVTGDVARDGEARAIGQLALEPLEAAPVRGGRIEAAHAVVEGGGCTLPQGGRCGPIHCRNTARNAALARSNAPSAARMAAGSGKASNASKPCAAAGSPWPDQALARLRKPGNASQFFAH